jgi:hypothetical protein
VAYSDADLTAIRTAIARGERSVTFADRTVTYRDMTELLQAEARVSQALASVPEARRRKQTFGVTSKGF